MKTIIFLHLLLTTLTIQLISSQEEPAPTPPPTPPPTINTGTNSWYYKYEKSGCAQDCLTSAGEDCGGVAQSWQLQYLYTTLEECCTTSTNLILELCISNSRFSIGDYTGSNLYYVGADSKCDKDCAVGGSGSGEDCGGIITSSSVELYNSIEECCGGGSASISNVQYCVSSSGESDFVGFVKRRAGIWGDEDSMHITRSLVEMILIQSGDVGCYGYGSSAQGYYSTLSLSPVTYIRSSFL